MAYDLIEPLNPAGMILKGLSGGKQPANTKPSAGNWRQFENNMLQHTAIVKGKK
jgi:hypothetical protein